MSRRFLNGKHEPIELTNPFRLKPAILFGIIFGIVILAAKAAQVYFGAGGLYLASALAGITSVDAIVISLSKIANGSTATDVIVIAIIIATITNNVVKSAITLFTGSKELSRYVFIGLGIISGVSVLYLAAMLI
jgi:uncharacterized membrane protein (DUF4010 family)